MLPQGLEASLTGTGKAMPGCGVVAVMDEQMVLAAVVEGGGVAVHELVRRTVVPPMWIVVEVVLKLAG